MIDSIVITKFRYLAGITAIGWWICCIHPSIGQDVDSGLVARGRVAFQRSCTDCHDADRSFQKQKSLDGWRSTVRRMSAMDGADVARGDIEAIAVYLAERNAPTIDVESENASDESQDTSDVESADAAEASAVEIIGSGLSVSGTFAPYWRGGNDNLENPNFFPDTWLTVDWQPEGRLRGRATACMSCHANESGRDGFTVEMVEAYVAFDLLGDRPCATRDPECGLQMESELRVGRMMVPFGDYANAHPGTLRAVTLPLMFNMGQQVERVNSRPPVLPMPYADEGALIHNAFRFRDWRATIALYGVNGLQGAGAGVNFTRSRSYTDNNTDVGFGSRVTIGNDCFQFGASWMSGRMQDDGSPPKLAFHLTGVDGTANLLDDELRFHVEYAIRRNDSSLGVRQIAHGTVTELDALLWQDPNVRMFCRYDTLEHRGFFGDFGIRRYTWGFSSTVIAGSRLMLNHEHWRFSDSPRNTDLVALRWIATF
ncbi:MAG: hypothetical protein AAGG48_21535 [Planctomycetota bacterium]